MTHTGTMSSKKLYGNYLILNPDGQPMCRCNRKKIDWYLSRNLAKVVDPSTIQLTFFPKGDGNGGNKFFLAKKDNVCVVCGSSESLTKHHLVPQEYRKHFPERIKKHNSYDVALLCVDCHKRYEVSARGLKKIIAKEMGIPHFEPRMPKDEDKNMMRAKRIATALLCHSAKMPAARKKQLWTRLNENMGKEIQPSELQDIAEMRIELLPARKSYGQQVVEGLPDLFQFVVRWRQHFVAIMKPKFLPSYWEIDKSLPKKQGLA